jgi:hypothetical protein
LRLRLLVILPAQSAGGDSLACCPGASAPRSSLQRHVLLFFVLFAVFVELRVFAVGACIVGYQPLNRDPADGIEDAMPQCV